MSHNFYTLALTAAGAPAMPVFLWNPQGRPLRYSEIPERTARLAQALRAGGLKPGDRLAAQVEKSAEAVLLYLACLRAGAVFLPLNTAYTLAELEYLLDDAEPTVLVCTPEKRAALAPMAVQRGVTTLHTLGADGGAGSLLASAARAAPTFDDVPRSGDDLAAILYTSGTTGQPKGAMITHGNLYSNATALRDCWRYGASDVLLHALPLFHIHGLFVAINVSLIAGAGIRLLARFDPELVFSALSQCTVMMGVPTFYTRLLQEARLRRESCAHLRLFVCGSAPLRTETHRAWRERTGHAILERYGMTETGINTSNPYDGERIAGTVGLPLPGVELRIADPASGAAVARGAVGMIEVRGPNVFAGYWRSPDKTREELRADGFFITGDLGRVDQHGYVQIVGRSKDLIISGGYNVYPKEVESALDQLPGVLESAVVGLPHDDLGEAVTAMVVPSVGTVRGDERAVIDALRASLAAYKCPKRVIWLSELPRNTMGKVQKNLLREQWSGLYRSEPVSSQASTQPNGTNQTKDS